VGWKGKDWIWFKIVTDGGACECSNEPSGSTKCREFD
jgi:hypothetical protein